MSGKERLSASIDSTLLRAAEQAVEAGRADTVSGWVNEALRMKVEHDRRLDALAAFVAAYEEEHGEITALEMRAATRRSASRALPSRPVAPSKPAGRRRRRS